MWATTRKLWRQFADVNRTVRLLWSWSVYVDLFHVLTSASSVLIIITWIVWVVCIIHAAHRCSIQLHWLMVKIRLTASCICQCPYIQVYFTQRVGLLHQLMINRVINRFLIIKSLVIGLRSYWYSHCGRVDKDCFLDYNCSCDFV